MKVAIKDIDKQFTEKCLEVEKFNNLARDIKFQTDSKSKLIEFLKDLNSYKKSAIEESNEEDANRILYYENIITTLINEFSMWISFKMDNPQDAWKYLVNAQLSLRSALLSVEVGDLLDHYVEKLDQLEQHLFPKLLFMSVGVNTKVKTCSVCSKNYDNCEHIKGCPYMGELCHAIIEECQLEEVSLVDVPANKHCRILTTSESGIKRDYMTWNEIEENITRGKR